MRYEKFCWISTLAAVLLFFMISFSGCTGDDDDDDNGFPPDIPAVQYYSYTIKNAYPHDRGAFTQGLVYHEGELFEGTGHYGQSALRKVELESGDVLQQYDLPSEYFGEGITVFKEKIYQLTWKEKTGFVYDLGSLELLEEFEYEGEGWGLTHDGESLIMSDGSSNLRYLHPETFEVEKFVTVLHNGTGVENLNELEYVNGLIYANIWKEDRIAIISPATGNVTGWIDCAGLLSGDDVNGLEDVLNGIAWDEEGQRLFLTGKWWPYLYEVALVLE